MISTKQSAGTVDPKVYKEKWNKMTLREAAGIKKWASKWERHTTHWLRHKRLRLRWTARRFCSRSGYREEPNSYRCLYSEKSRHDQTRDHLPGSLELTSRYRGKMKKKREREFKNTNIFQGLFPFIWCYTIYCPFPTLNESSRILPGQFTAITLVPRMQLSS